MDTENSVTEKTQSTSVESPEKSQTLTEACLEMKHELDDVSQQMGGRDNMSKPQTLTGACSTMKDEIKDEALRICPDPQTKQDKTDDRS